MASLRKLKAFVLGHNTDPNTLSSGLQEASVPLSSDECRGCAEPCDEGHDDYPARFDVDMETQMLGSVKPYRRQVIISTGKSDWPHDVTSESGSFASYFDSAASSPPKPSSSNSAPPGGFPESAANGTAKVATGIYDSSEAKKVTILNGSHHSVSHEHHHETVLVLPDYKVVTGVDRSKGGAEAFWKAAVDPKLGRAGRKGEDGSHKKRDNRCAIAAPKLQAGITAALERAGWEVHTQVEDPTHGPTASSPGPLEDLEGTPEEKEAKVVETLKSLEADVAEHKRALIVMVSHIGGHKFAGNVIIQFPSGASVWYGRVSPHTVEAVVRETIIGGKILPPLLRGGINLSRPGKQSLLDW